MKEAIKKHDTSMEAAGRAQALIRAFQQSDGILYVTPKELFTLLNFIEDELQFRGLIG